MAGTTEAGAELVAEIEALAEKLVAARAMIDRRFIGQERVVELALAAMLCGGHGLLVGLPGLGKTLLVDTLATVMGLKSNRIQFTPDLMPADILGSEVLETAADGSRAFRFIEGPIFCQLLMADEINRASPRTQSALLQAMQEREVTVAGVHRALGRPFHVLATQNPIEQEGTYPLPEAQLDRFMFLIEVEYPSADEEKRIARETTGTARQALNHLLDGQRVLAFQQLVRRVPVPEHLYEYAVSMVRKTRPNQPESPQWIKETVGWGAGPRAVQYLILGAKARAALRGAYMASLEDIEAVASSVLTHRVITNFAAESQGMTSKKIVERLVKEMREE